MTAGGESLRAWVVTKSAQASTSLSLGMQTSSGVAQVVLLLPSTYMSHGSPQRRCQIRCTVFATVPADQELRILLVDLAARRWRRNDDAGPPSVVVDFARGIRGRAPSTARGVSLRMASSLARPHRWQNALRFRTSTSIDVRVAGVCSLRVRGGLNLGCALVTVRTLGH